MLLKEGKGKGFNFRDVGCKIIIGFDMVHLKNFREVGAFVCSPFTNYNKSKELYLKNVPKKIFTYVQLIAHMNLR